HRDDTPADETLREHRERPTRESLLWVQGTEPLPGTRKLLDVCDQGADTFEFLEHEFKSGRRFVIRAYKTRKVALGHDPQLSRCELKSARECLPELGRFTMDVQPKKGRSPRKNAELIVRGGAVLVDPPHAKRGYHGNAPLAIFLVSVTEVAPPPGEDPIAWT